MKSQLEREKLFSLSNEPSAWGAAQLRAAPCPVAKATKSDALAENETEWAFLVIYKQFDSGSGHRCSIPIWSALPVSSALFVCSFVTRSHPLADKDTKCGFAPCPKAGTGTGGGSLVREEAQTGRYGASLQEQLLAVHKLHLTWQICCCPSGDSFIRFDALLWICISVLPLGAADSFQLAQSSGTHAQTQPNYCSFIGFSFTVLGKIVGGVFFFFFSP